MIAKKLKTTQAARVLGSNWFFVFIIIFFSIQTIWIALSAIYPMLFDEEYHLGIIDIYSRQFSPFIYTQPPEASFHGDITRYGSYMFHYLMSFPYRLTQLFNLDLQSTIVAMRLVSIGFVVAGLFVFRAFLLRAGLTKSLAHLAIGFFTLIPLVPFAMSQINYDSLAFLLIAAIFYLAIRSTQTSNKQIHWIVGLLSVSALACLVKFTILPIAFSTVLFVIIMLCKKHKKQTLIYIRKQISSLPKLQLIGLSLLFIFAVGMFGERYATNIVKYQTIEPKCDRIHSRDSCIQYTVWRRDTTWKANNDAINKPRDNPFQYTSSYWAPHIFNDFFVTAAFVYQTDKELEIRYLPTTMKASAGNPLLRYAGWVMFAISVVVLAVSWRKLPLAAFRYIVLMTVLIYAVSLWSRNYSDYINIGAGTAAQGRYFIPLLIPIFAMVGLAFRHYLVRIRYQLAFLLTCGLLLSQGGGVATYILYSNTQWYWPEQRKMINDINTNARKILRSYTLF